MLKLTQAATNRREFLVRSAATAAGTFLNIGLPALGSSAAKAEGMSSFTPSIWFTLTPDGKVTMHIVKCEMGQHIGTGLAQVIAEELEVNWEDVRLGTPLESVENFAIYGLAYTVNSTRLDQNRKSVYSAALSTLSMLGGEDGSSFQVWAPPPALRRRWSRSADPVGPRLHQLWLVVGAPTCGTGPFRLSRDYTGSLWAWSIIACNCAQHCIGPRRGHGRPSRSPWRWASRSLRSFTRRDGFIADGHRPAKPRGKYYSC